MNSWILKIFLCISLLISCSSEENKSEIEKKQNLSYSELIYGLKIDEPIDPIEDILIEKGLKKSKNGFEGEFEGIDVCINLSGARKIGYWKIKWSGNKKRINSFSKRLINVLKTEYSALQGENNYYSCRFKSGNSLVILELTIWDDKIELINR